MYDEIRVGDRFAHFTVIAEATPAVTLSKRRRWLCKCDCGNERIVEEPNLRHGKSTNCGCVRYRNMIGNKYSSRENAHHKDRLYHIWVAMRSRCNSKTNTAYRNYGAKVVVNAKPPKQSNYDRLISKSPEELAEWLTLCLWGEARDVPFLLSCTVDKWLDWLKEEATDGKQD